MIDPECLAFVGTSDLSGLLRGISVPWAALERLMGRGIVLPGHVPLRRPGEPAGFGGADLLLLPDPATRSYVPAPDAPDLVLLLGDLLEPDGAPWACCPRYFLRRALAALHAEWGMTVRAGFVQGFALPPGPAAARSFGALRHRAAFCGRLLAAMRTNGMTPETMHPDDQPGRFEVGAAATTGVSAADQAVVLRELIAATALLDGMAEPAPAPSRLGIALVDGFGQSAMADGSGEHGLSDEAEHLIAGVLHHLPALASVLGVGSGPARAELAVEGRPGPVRLRSDGGEDGAPAPSRLELTVAEPLASPYLALGAVVWAGLDGLRQHRRLHEQPHRPMPACADDALDLFGESVCVAEWFGMELREQFLHYHRRAAGRGRLPTD